jgi:hypothetical protein
LAVSRVVGTYGAEALHTRLHEHARKVRIKHASRDGNGLSTLRDELRSHRFSWPTVEIIHDQPSALSGNEVGSRSADACGSQWSESMG